MKALLTYGWGLQARGSEHIVAVLGGGHTCQLVCAGGDVMALAWVVALVPAHLYVQCARAGAAWLVLLLVLLVLPTGTIMSVCPTYSRPMDLWLAGHTQTFA